ncbi:choice-of-anchor Q domain-containing protein, partial [Dokdonella sp.]
ATDQRGMPRNGAVDIGAFEVQADLIFAHGFE